MNKLREIECFIAVAELGSFVKAADALNISKAAVSLTILELEGRLGARLMQRTTRRLSLTEAGVLYLERCKQIVTALEEADQVIGAGISDPTGLLRINAPQSFGVLHIRGSGPACYSAIQEYSLISPSRTGSSISSKKAITSRSVLRSYPIRH